MDIRRQAKDSLIVALDVDSRARAMELVEMLSPMVNWFKVGMELFSAEGPGIVREITSAGAKVFVDLKFHDIPNTVSSAGAAIARSGAAMFNVHCSGGKEMMRSTVERAREVAAQEGLDMPKIIGVTVLTSMTEQVLQGELGVNRDLTEQVRFLAVLAQEAGLDGVVASPREIGIIREACGPEFLIVTPGVRPVWASLDDQRRVMTPGEAFRMGATHLVVGRPITAAADPQQACRKILEEMEELPMTDAEITEVFTKCGALHQGHFRYTSGLHGDKYMQCAQIQKHPQYNEMLCKELADKFRDEQIDVVVGPAIGGILTAYEVARQLGVPAIWTERENGEMKLRRGFKVEPGLRVLVVEDVITTGGSVQEVLDVVKAQGGTPVGVGVMVDRSGGKARFEVPLKPLLKLNLPNYEPDNCPLCKQGLPIAKPGSRQA